MATRITHPYGSRKCFSIPRISSSFPSSTGTTLPPGVSHCYRRPRRLSLKALMENKVIGKTLYGVLEKMAKFRNVVVRQYETIDPTLVVSILHKNLHAFEKYKNSIIKYLSSHQDGK
jgi:hypothetical protein